MPGLGRDHDAGAAARDDIAELLEHHRCAIKIDLQDRGWRSLGRRHAGGMDKTSDLSQTGRCGDERFH